MEHIYAKAVTVSRAFTWVGGAALLGCAFLITYDIITRKFFGYSMAGTDEISGFVFSVATAWALSYCVLDRANIRIDAGYRFFRPMVRSMLDILGNLLFLFFASVLLHGAVVALTETIKNGTISTTGLSVPIWIPQSLWVVGIAMLVGSLLLQITYSLMLLLRRDWAGVAHVAGIPSTDEMIRSETGSRRE